MSVKATMPQKPGDAVKHHSYPKFCLKKFGDPGQPGFQVWQYEKGQKPRLVHAKHATVIKHHNTLLLSPTLSYPGSRFDSNIVEQALNVYETRAAVLYE